MRHPKHPRTKAQAAAAHKFAAAGRAAQHRKRAFEIAHNLPTRTKAQTQASLKWAASGRASQARKAAGLKPIQKAKPALALDDAGGLHDLPVCAATALAAHLAATTRVVASEFDILALNMRAAGGALADFMEAARDGGLGGYRLASFWQCDEDEVVPGLVYGVGMLGGYHAVLAHPDGMVSWGMILPRIGVPREAWYLDWEIA